MIKNLLYRLALILTEIKSFQAKGEYERKGGFVMLTLKFPAAQLLRISSDFEY